MAIIDIIILIVTVGALVYGFWRGFIVQLGAVAGLIVGVLACRLFGDSLAVWIGDVLPSLSDNVGTAMLINRTIAYVILFIVCYCSVRLLASLVKTITSALFLGVFDRILGALFSLLQWMIVLSLVVNFICLISPNSTFIAESTLANGHAIGAVRDLAPAILGFLN